MSHAEENSGLCVMRVQGFMTQGGEGEGSMEEEGRADGSKLLPGELTDLRDTALAKVQTDSKPLGHKLVRQSQTRASSLLYCSLWHPSQLSNGTAYA